MTSSPRDDSSQFRAARRRRPATVSLDLRQPGRAAAVAVDGTGTVLAWALLHDDGDPAALAKRSLEKLSVRPRAVRVLLGARAASVGVFQGAGTPDEHEISDTLLAEGHERLDEPAVAAVLVARETWLVAAATAETLEELAEELVATAATEPAFVVDQLLVAERLEGASAVAEYGGAELLVAAQARGSAPLLRSVDSLPDAEQAALETFQVLEMAGFPGSVRVMGSERTQLRRQLTEKNLESQEEPTPSSGREILPAGLELAWHLAVDPSPPALQSPRIERRRTSLGWARRTTWAAIALGLLGALMVAGGLKASRSGRAQSRALAAEAAGVEEQMRLLRETSELAEEVQRLRSGLAGQILPWPRLARTLALLADGFPPGVGCRRLAITDGDLELEASAAGTTPERDLELLRWTLDRSPGITNLSWDEPSLAAERIAVHQIFRAKVLDPSPTPPRGAP